MSAWDAAYYSLWLSSLGFLTTLILIAHDRMWLWYCLQNLLLGLYFVGLDGDFGHWLDLTAAQNEQLTMVLGVTFLTYCFPDVGWANKKRTSPTKTKTYVKAVSGCVVRATPP